MPQFLTLRNFNAAALGLGLLAIALYLPMIGWGLPYATAPDRTKTFATDEILPLEGLAEMHNTFIVSKPDRNYGYPWWHYFVVSVAQAPYLVYLMFSGGMQAPAAEYPFGLRDPVEALQWLTLIGRAVSVLMAAGVVVAAYYFSAILWGRFAGTIAALLTMLNYLMFYYSRTGNLDVPAFFWSSIGLAIFAKVLVEGFSVRRAAWLGVFTGLAVATKDQAVVIFLPLGCVLLLPHFSWSHDTGYRLRPILAGLGGALLAYLIGTGMIIDPQRHLTHVYSLFFDQSRITAGAAYWAPQPKTWTGTMHLIRDYIGALVAMASPLLLLTSLAGALIVLRSSPWYLVLMLPVLTLFLMLILPTGVVVQRYLLPLTLILDAFAARALSSLRLSYHRPAWLLLLLVLCGWRLLVGADLTYAQYHDTRYGAAKWIQSHVEPDDRIEYFGVTETLPPLPVEIKTQRVAGRTHWVGEFGHGPFLLRYLAEQGPEYLVVIPDWTSKPGMERSADCPAEVFTALVDGRVGYTQAAFFSTPSLFFGSWRRPSLDNPSVAPPVRIFARNDILKRDRGLVKPQL
jgi:4-amino-4-deoxy-L-arabinose transferase-like glycosyltransferase